MLLDTPAPRTKTEQVDSFNFSSFTRQLFALIEKKGVSLIICARFVLSY